MRRRRVWVRRIGRGVATVAVGALLGFLVPMVAADLAPQPEVAQERVAESPVARQFIDAFVADDQAALDALAVSIDVQNRATRFKAEYAKVDRPVHLGSWIVNGGITLHAYSAHVVDNTGAQDQLAWRVATAGGTVGIIDPPGQVATP
jgi:hypothetical protein